MKIFFFVFFVFICSCSSSSRTFLGQSSNEKHFKSRQNHGYGGRSTFRFKSDSTFVYYGTGPSTLFSEGQWSYYANKGEILLTTDMGLKPKFVNPIDTMWVDLSEKRIRILTKKKIIFEGITYFAQ